MEKNKIELTGTIHKLFKQKTKAGSPMAKMLLQVGKDTFWVLSYGNVADAIGCLDEGDELAITGTAQMNNWKTDAGEWKNDFNAVAWTVEIDGTKTRYEKDQDSQEPSVKTESTTYPKREPDEYDYTSGPF